MRCGLRLTDRGALISFAATLGVVGDSPILNLNGPPIQPSGAVHEEGAQFPQRAPEWAAAAALISFDDVTFAVAALSFGNFLPIHRDVARRLDADAHLGPVYCHDGHFDVVADAQGFTGPSCQYEHCLGRGVNLVY